MMAEMHTASMNNQAFAFTVEEVDERIQQLLKENYELRNTLQQNNTYMRLLINTLTDWHNEVDQTQKTYSKKFEEAKGIVNKLKAENRSLKEKLQRNKHAEQESDGIDLHSTHLDQEIAEYLDSFVMIPHDSDSSLPHISGKGKPDCCTELNKESLNLQQKLGLQYENLQLANKQDNQHFESIRMAQQERLKQLESNKNILNQQCKDLLEKVSALNEHLSVAEELVISKQTQNTELLMEVARLEKNVEVIPILKAQLELYQSDFEAEREARQNLAGEKDALTQELRLLKQKLVTLESNAQLSSSDQAFEELPSPHPSFECPKCNFKYSTYTSLNNHLDECLNQQMFPI